MEEVELMEICFYKYTKQSPSYELRSFPFRGTQGEGNIEDLSGKKINAYRFALF
jgi:hypothetical protein